MFLIGNVLVVVLAALSNGPTNTLMAQELPMFLMVIMVLTVCPASTLGKSAVISSIWGLYEITRICNTEETPTIPPVSAARIASGYVPFKAFLSISISSLPVTVWNGAMASNESMLFPVALNVNG